MYQQDTALLDSERAELIGYLAPAQLIPLDLALRSIDRKDDYSLDPAVGSRAALAEEREREKGGTA